MPYAISIKKYIPDIISFLFILLFVYAASSKLFDYQNFKAQLGRSPLLARFWNWIWIVPTVEILIALLLPFQKTKLLGLYASFSLMTMFTAYIFAILQFSEFIPCSCGGVLSKMSWTEHMWFNIVFILLALSGILLKSKRSSIS
ncbi:MAG TPA: MauE/DoxX family redox-associated membrane protein [Puia sp.]|nr:MauE/DoxX family redox-associated membrane protein [Puia sp.]